jgi:sugar-phosphatase
MRTLALLAGASVHFLRRKLRTFPFCGLSLEACDTFRHVLEEGSLASPVEVQTRGILFDLDGVLVDSTPAVARCWSRWAVQYGFNADEVVRQAHGRPSIATLRELMPNGDYEEENRKMEEWEIADTDGVVPLPGVLKILQALPAERWAIVTSCTPALAEVRIRVAGLPRPRKIVTSGDVQRFKPEPDPYLKGAELLGFAPADCVVVEDAPAGFAREGRPLPGCWLCGQPKRTNY